MDTATHASGVTITVGPDGKVADTRSVQQRALDEAYAILMCKCEAGAPQHRDDALAVISSFVENEMGW